MVQKNILKISFVALFMLTCAPLTHAVISLNGVATHSELGKEMFIAGLYTTTLSDDKSAILLAQEEKQIQVRVTAERLSSRRFKRMWIEGMAVNSGAEELKEQSGNMAIFSNMLKIKMTKGDIFTVERYDTSIGSSVESNVRVSLNGATLGEISDTNFFDLLLRTWLGPVPLSSDFRSNLLKGGAIDAELRARYDATVPSDERIAAVEEAAQTLTNSAPSAAPRVSQTVPDVAVAAPPVAIPSPRQSSTTTAPAIDSTDVAIAAPTAPSLNQQTPPRETQAQPPAARNNTPATTTPKPVEVAKANTPAPTQPAADSMFDEEDDGGDFTAESVLSQQLYVSKLKSYSNKYLKYPNLALQRGYEGNVRVSVVIDRNGKVLEYSTLEESEHSSLNKAATKAVKKASPFPKVPDEVSGETFTFTLPIVFKLVAE